MSKQPVNYLIITDTEQARTKFGSTEHFYRWQYDDSVSRIIHIGGVWCFTSAEAYAVARRVLSTRTGLGR
jgi:hypothetical protein